MDQVIAAPRPVAPPTRAQLVAEWDQAAHARHQHIAAGGDVSYSHMLVPTLRRLGADLLGPHCRILDAGCGTGIFAAELAADYPACHVVGVDPSPGSIALARAHQSPGNLQFEQATVETFAAAADPHSFDLAVANMVLQNVASLPAALAACRQLLAPGGALVFTIPHPCFWPRHWDYEQQPWFRYDRELPIQAPLRSLGNGATTTHTHRPLATYIEAFTTAGLALEELAEPFPDDELAQQYLAVWPFPRYLFGRCRPIPEGAQTA